MCSKNLKERCHLTGERPGGVKQRTAVTPQESVKSAVGCGLANYEIQRRVGGESPVTTQVQN